MSERGSATKITVEYLDGEVGRFEAQQDGSWTQVIGGMRVTGYDAPNVLRVLANGLGTREVAE